MSADARLRLIHLVLSAIPTYLITIFKLDAWDIKQIDKPMEKFPLEIKAGRGPWNCFSELVHRLLAQMPWW